MISDLVPFRGQAEEHLLRESSFNSMTTRVLVVMKLGRSESSMMISRLGEYTVVNTVTPSVQSAWHLISQV